MRCLVCYNAVPDGRAYHQSCYAEKLKAHAEEINALRRKYKNGIENKVWENSFLYDDEACYDDVFYRAFKIENNRYESMVREMEDDFKNKRKDEREHTDREKF